MAGGPRGGPATGDRARRAFAAALLLATLVYLPQLGNGFTYDDHSMIVANPNLRPGAAWSALLGQSLYGHDAGSGSTHAYYRPVMYLLYRLAWAAGGGAPWAFHALGLAAHLLAVALARTALLGLGFGPGAAAAVAALFALHPLAAEVVCWTPAVVESLQTGAMLAALAAAQAGFRAAGTRRAALAAGAALATACGLLAKEAAIAIAPVLALAAWASARGERARRLAVVAPAFAVTAAWLALRASVLRPPELGGERPELLWSLGRAGRALLWDAAHLVWPWPLTHVHPFPLAPGREALDLAGAALVAALPLAVLAVLLLRPSAALWFGWPLAAVAPTLFHFFAGRRVLSGVVVADRYVYPALVPVLALAVRGLVPRLGRAGPGLVAALALAGGGLSLAHSRTFRDDGTLFSQARRHGPDSAFVLNQLAAHARRSGRPEEAVALLERAVAAEPDALPVRLNLAAALIDLGRAAQALPHAAHAAALDPAHPGASGVLGRSLLEAGRFAEAAEALAVAARLAPSDPQVHADLGLARYRAGDLAGAIAAWEAALALAPGEPRLLFSAGVARAEAGDSERARRHLERFLQAAPAELAREREAAARLLGRRGSPISPGP